jgi:thioredoxin-dependent peroxiredoxin
MATVTFQGQPLTLVGTNLDVGDRARDIQVTGLDLSPVLPLEHSQGKVRLFITVPSLDTEVCSLETKKFSNALKNLSESVAVYLVSADLPFAQKRWSETEAVDNITMLSDYRGMDFARSWGLFVQELGLMTRAIFVVDPTGVVTYSEVVPELTSEPDYEAAIAAVNAALP